MNGLEAFYRQKELIEYHTNLDVSNWLGDFNQIEKELRAYDRLIKALDLKQPIFVKDFQGVCEFDDTVVSSRFITNGNQLALVDDFSGERAYLNLDEYGKTWAFSEEELE